MENYYFLAILIPSMLFLIAFNPAITSTDSEGNFNSAHLLWTPGYTLKDSHPPFYIFMLNCMLRIVDSISFVIIINDLYFSYVFYCILLYMYKNGVTKKHLIFIYLFCVLSISNLLQLATLWKDVPFTISLIWLTFLLIEYVESDENVKPTWYIKYVIAMIFTALLRQNGILCAAALIMIMPFVCMKRKNIIISTCCVVLLFILIKGPLYTAMGVIPAPEDKFPALTNDMMNAYYRGNKVSSEVMEIINIRTDNNPDQYEYSPFYVNGGTNIEGISLVQFLRIYIVNFFDHPRDTFMAILERNTPLWSIPKPKKESRIRIAYTGEYHKLQVQRYPYRRNNFLTDIFVEINNVLSKNIIITYIIYWRAGIYNLLIFIMFAIYIMRKQSRFIKLVPFVPILFNLLSLAIASGWGGNFRYFWPAVIISVLLLYYFNSLIIETKQ